MVISAVILSLLVVAGLAGTLKDASAGGSVTPSNPKVNLYFHGDGSYLHKGSVFEMNLVRSKNNVTVEFL